MTGCIVKHKEGLGSCLSLLVCGLLICCLLKNINGMVDLFVKVLSTKITLTIFAGFE